MERSQLDEINEWYLEFRPLLLKLAYRLTGMAADAEDTVQDVFAKVAVMDRTSIQQPKAFLCRMVSNRCLDLLRSSRRKRETYVGPWLPEPLLLEAEAAGPEENAVTAESVSYAMLTLLERLTPAERAAFVLREAFGFEYADIAAILEKAEPSCRKLISRARQKLHESGEPSALHEPQQTERVAYAFLQAAQTGDLQPFLALLTNGAVLYSDGGGKVMSAVNPISGIERIARFLIGIGTKAAQQEAVVGMQPIRLHGGDLGVAVTVGGEPFGVFSFRVTASGVHDIYVIRNPDKLRNLALV